MSPANYEQDRRSSSPEPVGCSPIVVLGLLGFMFMFTVCLGIGAYVYVNVAHHAPAVVVPDNSAAPVAALASDIKAVMSKTEGYKGHALYLSKFCKGVSGRLLTNYRDKETPIHDTTGEALSLVYLSGEYGAMVDGVNAYAGLDKIIESELSTALGVEDEVEEGPLTPAQQRGLVEMFSRLGDAFAEVAGE